VATIAVVVVAGLAILGSRPSVGGPAATPTPSPTQAAAASTPQPTSRAAGAILAPDGTDLVAGTRYSTGHFVPVFTFAGQEGWRYLADGQTYAWFEHALSGIGSIVVPRMLFAVGGATEAVPADLVAWFQARTDLDLQPPKAITLGGRPATLLEGVVNATAVANGGGAINIACPKAVCAFEDGGSLGVDPDSHFEIVVVDVDGQPVIIAVGTRAAPWSEVASNYDAFIRSFEFPAS